MQIYTSCESCNFFSQDQERCSEGLWDREGFKDIVKYDKEAGGHIIPGKVCPMHRAGGKTTFQEAVDAASLSYGLVINLRANALDNFLGCLQGFCELEESIRPKSVYVIDNREEKADQEDIRNKIESLLSVHDIKFKYKSTLDTEWKPEKYLDEYAVSGVLKTPFYVYFDQDEFDGKFLKGLWHKIYYDMLDVMYAGKDTCYFAPTAIHKVCRSGIDKFLRKEKLDHTIFSYEELCQTI